MMKGQYEIEISDKKITEVLSHLTHEKILKICQIVEQYGKQDDEIRYYDVYKIYFTSSIKILKKESNRGVFNYETILSVYPFPVPKYYGKYVFNDENWILLEYIEGYDCREMTVEIALMAAKSLSEIQNVYWQNNEDEFKSNKIDNRFEIYYQRILKRASSIHDEYLKEAYQLFLNRQLTIPRTCSNGDFLQFNAMKTKERVVIIDWGFGGILPYALDIARFIAHATVDKATFPFYMTNKHKEIFIHSIYESLKQKPPYHQYLLDIKLAILNEYIEFIEANEDENNWYFNHAILLAKDILNKNEK